MRSVLHGSNPRVFYGRSIYRKISTAAFSESLTVLVLVLAPDLTANLTAGKIRRVHVCVGETGAQEFQGRVEITCGNALAGRPHDICRRNRSRDSSRSGRRTSRLAPATT